jgi:N-acetylneuraminate synthase
LEPLELKHLCEASKDVSLAIGHVNYERSDSERKSIMFRRSIYITKDIEEGEVFTQNNIRVIRPGSGLAPSLFSEVIGKKAAKNCTFGTPLTMDLVEK